MTLNKRMVRELLDMFFDQYGPDQRFEFGSINSTVSIIAQNGKQRIPHENQVSISRVGFDEQL